MCESVIIILAVFFDRVTTKRSLYTIGMLSSLIGGGIFYSSKFPESYYPGKFDLFGSSHNIMHLFLIISHICQYQFVILSDHENG